MNVRMFSSVKIRCEIEHALMPDFSSFGLSTKFPPMCKVCIACPTFVHRPDSLSENRRSSQAHNLKVGGSNPAPATNNLLDIKYPGHCISGLWPSL